MIQVLVVDDDFRVAEIHGQYVQQSAGFDVVGSARTIAEASMLVKDLDIDLILLDIYLPDGSGIDLLASIQSTGGADVIILTAARDVVTVKRCSELGALHYLIKPFARAELENRLHQYRNWKLKVEVGGDLDQGLVDAIFDGPGGASVALPKGLSQATMDLVVQTLTDAEGPLSSEEVAQMSGVSRVSIRRYLRHLADTKRAELIQDYGVPGRPLHRFQLSR